MEPSKESPGQLEPALSNQDVDSLLTSTSRSRQRIRKACYPCNKRKIKCDRDERTPCSNCAKRPHPELCTFDDHAPRSNNPRPRPSVSHRPSSQSPVVSHGIGYHPATSGQPLLHNSHSASAAYTITPQANGTKQTYNPWERSHNGLDGVASTPGSARPMYNFVGNATASASKSNAPQETYSHPGFQSINSTDSAAEKTRGIWEQVSSLLPPQKHVLRFFDIYRTMSNPLYPLPDIDEFESAVCTYFEDVTSNRLRSDLDCMTGQELEARLSWFAMLSAAVATGIQFSDIKQVKRKATIHEYFRNAMQLLRMSNFLFRPTETSIMTLLLLSRILQNEFQPEASWSVLGMLIRSAETIGLNRDSATSRSRKIWWAIASQDSYLCMCFGRPTDIDTGDSPPNTTFTDFTFVDCLYVLTKHAVNARQIYYDQPPFRRSIDAITTVRQLHERALPRLADKQKCRSVQDRMEYFAFRIYQGFMVSYLSQELMRTSMRNGQDQQMDILISMCRGSAIDCIQAYIDMQSFSVVPARIWSLTFNAVRSALLLGTLNSQTGESNTPEGEKVRDLLTTLYNSLQMLEEEDMQADQGRIQAWPETYPKAMEALRDMATYETSNHDRNGAGVKAQNGVNAEAKSDEELRSRMDIFRDPAASWNEYFASSATGSDSLPQQLFFGI